MLLEITVDFIFSVIPVFVKSGLCILIVADKVIVLFFVSLVHFKEDPMFMLIFESFNFESTFLSIIIFSIDFMCLHNFVFIVKILLYFLQGPLHLNKIKILNNINDINKNATNHYPISSNKLSKISKKNKKWNNLTYFSMIMPHYSIYIIILNNQEYGFLIVYLFVFIFFNFEYV